jgi:alpha-glucosidase
MTFISNKTKTNQNIAIGDVIFWEKSLYGISGKTDIANFAITIYDHTLIRIQVNREDNFSPNPYSVISKLKGIKFEWNEVADHLILKTSKIHLKIGLHPFCLTFMTTDGKIINQDDPAFAVSWLGTEVSNYKKVQHKEKFIGLGEKTGNLNRAGRAYTNWNTDYFAYGVNDDPLYMSIPFYMGIHNQLAYGIFFDNTHKTVFNFGASNNRFIYYSAEDGDLDYYFFTMILLDR